MTTNYKRGADFERRVLADMSARGYVSVRSAGSHTVADVYCFRYGEIVLIQCKRDGRLGPEEWNALYDHCQRAGAIPVLAKTGPGNRGITYWKLIGRKGGRGRQPLVPWAPQERSDDGNVQAAGGQRD